MQQDTEVTYPQGAVSGKGVVVRVVTIADGQSAIVVDRTPFHPVDYQWPDQPGDRGNITLAEEGYKVLACLTGAIDKESDELYLATNIPVKKGAEGWNFVVAHIISGEPDWLGQEVELTVDADYRRALDRGHSACHLVALALNQAVADYWKKSPGRLDARGMPDFDQLAITQSEILENGSLDIYRCGKSLRKKGLKAAELFNDLGLIETEVNSRLQQWLNQGGRIELVTEGPGLIDRRYWHCQLEGEDRWVIPCGGSHITTLADYAEIRVQIEHDGDQGFRVKTQVR